MWKLQAAIFAGLIFAAIPVLAADKADLHIAVKDQLTPLAPGAVQLEGRLGERIELCIKNRLMLQNTQKLVDAYKTRDQDVDGFKGEFFGKWATAAALACRYQPNSALQAKADETVGELIHTATPDGYLSTYKPAAEFHVWDVWNQKYNLLGLIAQYVQTGNAATLDAADKSASHVIDVNGPGKQPLEEYGPDFHKGAVNYSILEPTVLLYEQTGDKKFLTFAQSIVASWSQPCKYDANGVRYIEKAEAEAPLAESDELHAYTLMSCFEGLAELYRATGDPKYLDATIKFAKCVEQQELMIHGTVSNQELWCHGAIEQTQQLEKPGETCATVTWIKFCDQLLRLTGDPHWADEMEQSLYNALLGEMMPHGEWWSYESPLAGERVPSRQQYTDVELSCCVSNGPRALLLTPQWTVMSSDAGPVVNLYCPGSAVCMLSSGKQVNLTQVTDYPADGMVALKVEPQESSHFVLRLRIPKWSAKTTLAVNGQQITCKPGTYASIDRTWASGDTVKLELDMRGRIIAAPSGAPERAIMRGPILLACDSRLIQPTTKSVWLVPHPDQDIAESTTSTYKGYVSPGYNVLPADEQSYIDLKPVPSADPNIWMTFEVPFVVRPSHYIGHHVEKLLMCDFSSAGDEWRTQNCYRTWLPQPMLLSQMYASETWKIMYPGIKERPAVPADLLAAMQK